MESGLIAGEPICPSCGRFAGAYETCPYCHASIKTRMSLKIIKRLAVAGSLVGLLLLYLGVQYKQIPKVQIGALDLRYNMAIAQFEGTVTDIKIDEQKNSFRIWLDDGTGQAVLSGFNKYTKFKDSLGDRFPQIGDTVSASGNISMNEGFGTSGFLSSPRRFALIKRNKIVDMTLKEARHATAGTRAFFTIQIVSERKFEKGRALTVKDDSDELDLTIFDSEWTQIPESVREKLIPESTFSFRIAGRVDRFRDKPQLRLATPIDPQTIEIQTPQSAS
jgi:hypothetical protein